MLSHFAGSGQTIIHFWTRAVLLAATLAMASALCGAQDAGSLYGDQGVSPQAVREGGSRGDYFHASIASIAKAAPAILRGAISWNSHGWYQVHFSNGVDEAVFPEDVKYGRDHGFDRSDGDWVLVLMDAYAHRAARQGLVIGIQKSESVPAYAKPVALALLDHSSLVMVAYDRAIRAVVKPDAKMDRDAFKQALTAQFSALGIPVTQSGMLVGFLDDKGVFERLSNSVRQDGEVFGADKALGMGGIPVRVIEAFMGSAHALLVAEHDMTMDYLHRLHQGGMAMVAGTWGTAPGKLDSSNWWVRAHAFSVLDFDEDSKTVSMRNPWGKHPDPDGLFTLPLATFLDAFESCSFSD
jgi:hypothetical protein